MGSERKAWANCIFFIVTLCINTLGAVGLINGLTQKQISDKYVTLITPSPSTFSIWSVIYSLLLISIIVIIVKKNDPYYKKAVDSISGLFMFSCILNIAWIVLFSFELIELSAFFILGFLVVLTLICVKLLNVREGRRWLLPLSFGLYSGWLFIASVVNIAAALVKLKWDGFGLAPETWGIIILIAAVIILILVLINLRSAVFPLPIAWAYYGIYQYLTAPKGFKGEYGTLQIAALASMAILILISVILFIMNRFSVLPAVSKSLESGK